LFLFPAIFSVVYSIDKATSDKRQWHIPFFDFETDRFIVLKDVHVDVDAMMGDQLLVDWQQRMRGDANACDGWAFNWDHGECSTAQPTPRDSHATLFLITNHTDNPINDFTDFVAQLNRFGKLEEEKQLDVVTGPDHGGRTRTVALNCKRDKHVVLRGTVTENRLGENLGDPNVGFYAQLESTTQEGMIALRILEACSVHGYACIIDHDQAELDLGDGRTLVKVSGLASDDSHENNELATRFAIVENDQEIARCLLAYRDGSYDPSIGPTIAMMAVHKHHRGKNLLALLWYWVRVFIEENCTLECMSNDTSPGNVMIKATQLTNAIVETKNGKPVTDKDFCFDSAGFSVREQKGLMGTLMSNRHSKDEEAVLFIPLLSRETIRERTEYKGAKNIKWPNNQGARCCDHCSKVWIGHQRCSRCQLAAYCTRDCQRKDWRRHKKWCGKTKKEVHDILVEHGHRVRQSDGSYVTNIGKPPPGVGGMGEPGGLPKDMSRLFGSS
jgi:hypothetical protein